MREKRERMKRVLKRIGERRGERKRGRKTGREKEREMNERKKKLYILIRENKQNREENIQMRGIQQKNNI